MAKQTKQSEAEMEAEAMVEFWAIGLDIKNEEKTKFKEIFARGYETAIARRRQSKPFTILAKIVVALDRYKSIPDALGLARAAIKANENSSEQKQAG